MTIIASSGKNQKSFYYVGFFSALALLLPYFGHGLFASKYLNMRIISIILIILIIAYKYSTPSTNYLRSSHNSRSRIIDCCAALLIIIIFFYFQPKSGFIEFSSQVYDPVRYPNIKIGRILVNLLPVILLSRSVAPMINNHQFLRGMTTGFYFAGVLTLVMMAKNSNNIISTNYYEYTSGRLFSTISASLNILFFLLCAYWRQEFAPTSYRWIESVSISLLSLVAIFMLSQRTAMGIALIICSVMLMRGLRRGLFIYGIMSILAIIFLYLIHDDFISWVEYFPAQINRMLSIIEGQDDSVIGRLDAWEFAFFAFLENPLGHGLGSFPQYYGGLYPHNVFMEALFELGILGGLLVAALILVTFKWLISALFYKRFGMEEFVLFVGFMYSIKSGDIQSIGPWMFGLYVVANKTTKRKKSDRRNPQRFNMG